MSERDPHAPYGGPERRSSPRIKAFEPLPGELALDLESDVLKLSTGGMMIRLPFPLPIESRHRFTLVIEEAVMELSGVVRNCQSLGEAWPAYGVGVEFEKLDDDTHLRLERFVRAKLGR